MKRKILTVSVALPLSVLLAWGAIYTMVTAFQLPVEAPGQLVLVWALCALCSAVLFSLPSGGLLTLACCAAAMFWLWSVRGISLPIRALITRLSMVYNSAYHWGAVEFAGVEWQTMSLDLLLASWGGVIALAAVGAMIRGRGSIAPVLLSLPPLISTMVVTDTPPDALPLFCMFTALALILLSASVARQNPVQGAKLAVLAAVPTAVVLGCLFLLCPKDTYVNRAQERLDAITTWWENSVSSRFRGTGELGQQINPTPTVSASTRLSSIGPRRIIPYDVMDVTADFNGVLYLRGQDYDVYDGLSWVSGTDREEILPKSRWAAHRGLVTVSTRGTLGLTYLPAYPSRNYTLTNGRLENEDGETEFTWSVSSITMTNQIASSSTDQEALQPYLELPDSTREWAEPMLDQIFADNHANKTYGAAGETISLDIVIDPSDLGHWSYGNDAVEVITDYVSSSARYSLNTRRMDDSYDDFAQWFLEESDTGYCVHFATAATVLLRAAGIPARYVTGYMVSCEKDQTVTVESDRAHAWVEYYDADMHAWIVAEPTPPDDSDDEPETESVTAPPPEIQPLTEPEEETTAPTEAATRPGQNGGDVQMDITKEELHVWDTLRWFLLAALILAAIYLQRLVRIALRRRTLTGGPNRRALGLWQDVERLSAVLNREPPEALLELAQKAKFSQHKLTKDELRQFTDWLRDARQELKQRPLLHRLWCQYVLALW